MEKSETTQAYDIEYDTDYGDQVCDKEQVAKFGTMVTPAFYSVVIILSLVGNLLVLIILALYENLKSLTNIFILNMALSDLLFTASLPIWAVYDIWGWIFEEVTCKAITLIFYAGFYSSMLFLTIMTIHRYLAVVHPLSDLGTQKGCYGLLSSLTIWIVSFAAATPALIFTDVQLNPHTDMWHCEYKDVWWKEIGTYQQNLFFLSAFSVMVFCYVRILGKILKSRARMRNRTVKLIFSIVAVFFLGWTPYNVVIFLMKMSDYPDVPLYECEVSRSLDYAFYVCRLIAFSHCCLNPVFYAFLGVKFRNHLKVILSKVFHRQTSEVLQSRTVNVYSMGSMY